MGGSDQWGNITAGTSWWTAASGAQVHGLVFPLHHHGGRHQVRQERSRQRLARPERTSPYRFYQFWLNTDDRDVERYLKLFTFLPLEEVADDAWPITRRTRAGGRPSGCSPAR